MRPKDANSCAKHAVITRYLLTLACSSMMNCCSWGETFWSGAADIVCKSPNGYRHWWTPQVRWSASRTVKIAIIALSINGTMQDQRTCPLNGG